MIAAMGAPDVDATDDAVLLAAWRGGDRAAGQALVGRHLASLYDFFRNKVDDGVDDLIQQTFLAVAASIDQFRGDGSFRAYLFAIARHELYAHWRRRQRRDAELDVLEISVAALSTAGPARVVARHHEQRLLLQALRTLPLDLQIALELVYWEELSGPELAIALGIPEGTVRSRLRRGRELLARALEDLTGDPAVATASARELEQRLAAVA